MRSRVAKASGTGRPSLKSWEWRRVMLLLCLPSVEGFHCVDQDGCQLTDACLCLYRHANPHTPQPLWRQGLSMPAGFKLAGWLGLKRWLST